MGYDDYDRGGRGYDRYDDRRSRGTSSIDLIDFSSRNDPLNRCSLPGCRIFCGGLPSDVREREIEDLFYKESRKHPL